MDFADVTYEEDGPLAIVNLDRPRYRNAQSWQLLDGLDAALDHAVGREKVKVIIVRGAGDHFSSGHDLGTPEQEEERKRRGVEGPHQEYYDSFRHYNYDITHKWRNLKKPTIAMVHGYCIYGGWMIASAMDLIFAAEDAQFLAGLVEYFTVPWDVGSRQAKELLFESRFIDGREAKELGFVNRVYPREKLEEETFNYARRVAEQSAYFLRMAKLAVNKTQDIQGFSNAVEAGFHDYMQVSRPRVTNRDRPQGQPEQRPARRLGGVDLAVRGARGERPGL